MPSTPRFEPPTYVTWEPYAVLIQAPSSRIALDRIGAPFTENVVPPLPLLVGLVCMTPGCNNVSVTGLRPFRRKPSTRCSLTNHPPVALVVFTAAACAVTSTV